MNRYFGQIALLVGKDLRETVRRPASLLAALVFAVLLLFIFSLQLQAMPVRSQDWAAAFFWTILLFASFFTMNQSFAKEQEHDCHLGLLLAIEEKSVLFLAKALSNFLLLLVLTAAIIPLSIIFWDLRGPLDVPLLLTAMVLGNLGLSCIATLFAGITWQAQEQPVLLPILALPISIPLLLALVELTRAALGPGGSWSPWLYMIALFDVLFLMLPILLFDFILEV